MDIPRIIRFLKENYSYNADEIYECLSKLTDTLDRTMAAIQHSSTEAFVQRDFFKIKSYTEMADEINSVHEKIKGYMEQLSVKTPDDAPTDDNEIIEDSKELPREELESAIEDKLVENADPDDYKVDSSIKHSLYEDFSFKRPAAFEIDSVRIEVRDWRELFFLTCETLLRKDRSIFESFISDPSMNGRRVKYFSKSGRSMTSPRKIPGTDIYISMQLGANGAKRLISKMLRMYNMDADKYYVYFSEDYSNMLKK